MPIERAADHPTFELGGNAITSLAAPARGSDETALFRIDLPAGGALPAHHHDHFDVFTVTAGSASMYIGDDVSAGRASVTRSSCRRRRSTGSRRGPTARRSW